MYPYVIRISLVCHPYVLVCHSYAIPFVCHPSVVLPWTSNWCKLIPVALIIYMYITMNNEFEYWGYCLAMNECHAWLFLHQNMFFHVYVRTCSFESYVAALKYFTKMFQSFSWRWQQIERVHQLIHITHRDFSASSRFIKTWLDWDECFYPLLKRLKKEHKLNSHNCLPHAQN